MFKKLYFSLLFVIICIQPLSGAQLKAILVGDSVDQTIGRSSRYDVSNMQKMLIKVAENIELPFQSVILLGKKANAQDVMKQIEALSIEPDDIVVVYFSAHGVNNHNETQWPHLLFDVDDSNVDFTLVNNLIRSKGPKLMLSIADACNEILPSSVQLESLSARAISGKKLIKKNLEKLFLQTSGSIIVSSSHPGEYSWSDPDFGSDFTLTFLKCLNELILQEEGIDWDNLLDFVKTEVSSIHHPKNEKQTPQYVLDLY